MAKHADEALKPIFLQFNPQGFLSGNLDGDGLLALGVFDKRSRIILGESREGVGTPKHLDIDGNLIRV